VVRNRNSNKLTGIAKDEIARRVTEALLEFLLQRPAPGMYSININRSSSALTSLTRININVKFHNQILLNIQISNVSKMYWSEVVTAKAKTASMDCLLFISTV
jgi:broad specificity polyphosphatase/5'/3'-nucleotidase SurE